MVFPKYRVNRFDRSQFTKQTTTDTIDPLGGGEARIQSAKIY